MGVVGAQADQEGAELPEGPDVGATARLGVDRQPGEARVTPRHFSGIGDAQNHAGQAGGMVGVR